MVLGNKIDLDHLIRISKKDIQKFIEEKDIEYVEISNLKNH